MSRIKEYYHDELTNGGQRWVSQIFLVCPACADEVSYEVEVPEPNYAGEKSSDMDSHGEVEIYCSGCDNYFEGEAWAGPGHCEINLRDYPETEVACEPPGYERPSEDWFDDWQVPDDPTTVFKANLAELRELIETQAQEDGASLMNRMIFAQILTFLEAYFCDTLISGLRGHQDRLADFAAKDGSISQIGFRASAILRDPEHVRKTVEHNLKSRLYHQFGKGKIDAKGKAKAEGVPLWFAMAFGVSLTPNEEDLQSLRNYAALRHDCVHRNGKTKDDEELTFFDKTYLREALGLADRVVDHIDAAIEKLPRVKTEDF